MATDILIPSSQEHWLSLRVPDITSTDAAALFDLSPYKTPFELFHEKRTGELVTITPTERMRWGNRLESAIAHGVAEDMGWVVRPLKVYMRDPEIRMGSSFDFEIVHPEHGLGIMEIKNVDGMIYRKNWKDDGEGNIEAPEHIELQVQHQMEVSGYEWCAIVAMVNGNEAKVAYRRRDPRIGQAIRAKIVEFWKRIEDDDAPSPDYSKDAKLIATLYSQVNQGEMFDAFLDVEVSALVAEYQQARVDEAAAARRAEMNKAKILQRVGTAEKIVGAFGSINLSKTKDTEATVITAEMIGKTYGGRKGYRQFKPTWKEQENV